MGVTSQIDMKSDSIDILDSTEKYDTLFHRNCDLARAMHFVFLGFYASFFSGVCSIACTF